MKLTNLKLNESTIGKKHLLVDVSPYFSYENGQRTNTIEGYKYTVALPDIAFDKLDVKIKGNQQMEKPESYSEVMFEGLEIFIYWRAGTYEVGATATGIKAKTRS